MSNIAAQAASAGMTGSGVTNSGVMSIMGSGLFGGQTAAQFLANQIAQNNAANAAQSMAQQQLASQGVTPLGGVAGIANQVQGAGAAEQNALEAGGNPYADNEQNLITAGMAVGNAPIATAGNFNPQTEFAAARMFGPQKYRRKPLINF